MLPSTLQKFDSPPELHVKKKMKIGNMPTPYQNAKAIEKSIHNFHFSKGSIKYLSTSKSNILTYTLTFSTKFQFFKFRMEINNFFRQQYTNKF